MQISLSILTSPAAGFLAQTGFWMKSFSLYLNAFLIKKKKKKQFLNHLLSIDTSSSEQPHQAKINILFHKWFSSH